MDTWTAGRDQGEIGAAVRWECDEKVRLSIRLSAARRTGQLRGRKEVDDKEKK